MSLFLWWSTLQSSGYIYKGGVPKPRVLRKLGVSLKCSGCFPHSIFLQLWRSLCLRYQILSVPSALVFAQFQTSTISESLENWRLGMDSMLGKNTNSCSQMVGTNSGNHQLRLFQECESILNPKCSGVGIRDIIRKHICPKQKHNKESSPNRAKEYILKPPSSQSSHLS